MKKIVSLIIVLIIVLSIGGFSVFKFIDAYNEKKEAQFVSVNEDALKIKEGKCRLFYPDNENIRKDALSLCYGVEEDTAFDYQVISKGDMKIVTYNDDYVYCVGNNYEDLVVKDIDKTVLSSEFRYKMKESLNDVAYTSKFASDSSQDNIDINDFDFTFKTDALVCHSKSYDFSFEIPYEYIQKKLGYDFGIENKEYVIRRYIDPNRKIIALTFDDGPYLALDRELLDLTKQYDAPFTFFLVGNRIKESSALHIKEAIKYGNEYGSHSYDHPNLVNMSVNDAINSIATVENILDQYFDFSLKIYRPPFGNHNSALDSANPYIAILWNVDSLDWKYRDQEKDYDEIVRNVSDKDVILMHDLYEQSKEAAKRVVPDLIDKGYQFVTVSEMMSLLNVNAKVFSGQ